MWFRKETIKDGDSALNMRWSLFPIGGQMMHTCRRFSRSRAANFFISEAFAENLRIVSRPKDDISLYLVTAFVSLSESSDQDLSHRRSNSIKRFLSTESRMRRRWMKRDLHSPISTSCIRSTANIVKKLNPSGDNLWENAFLRTSCVSMADVVNAMPMYRRWHQRFWLQQALYGSTVNLILLLIYKPSCRKHLVAPGVVIDPGHGYSL
jgi:hypothetical protein